MAANNSIMGVTTTKEMNPDTANSIQNIMIKQKQDTAKLIPHCRLNGINKIPIITPATSVRNTAIEYLTKRTIKKQTKREAKMIDK